MPSSKTFVPYRFETGLQIRATKFMNVETGEAIAVSSTEIGEGTVRRAYDLWQSKWRALDVELKLEQGQDALARVVHRGEDLLEVTRVVASIRCSSTKYRIVRQLAPDNDGTWRGRMRVNRALVRGAVEVAPLVFRRVQAPTSRMADRAVGIGALIGEGHPLVLRVDEAANPFEGGLPVRWEDFRASPDPWRKSHDDHVFALSFEPNPTLYLNSRHAHLQAVMNDPNAAGPASVAKAVALALVSQGTLMALFEAALSMTEVDPETGAREVPDGWARDAIFKLLPGMYPELGSRQARMDALFAALESGASAPEVRRRLVTAVQGQVRTADVLHKLVRLADGA